MFGKILGAGNDSGFVVGGEAHGLCFVELGVLEGGDADEGILQRRGEFVLGKVDLVGEGDFKGFGQVFSGDLQGRFVFLGGWKIPWFAGFVPGNEPHSGDLVPLPG